MASKCFSFTRSLFAVFPEQLEIMSPHKYFCFGRQIQATPQFIQTLHLQGNHLDFYDEKEAWGYMVRSYHLKFLNMWDHISRHVTPQMQSFDAHVAARPSGAQQSHTGCYHYCLPPIQESQCGTELSAASQSACRPIRESTSEAISWDRSPIRRKHRKRKSFRSKSHQINPLATSIKYLLITCCIMYYYTSDNRTTIPIVMMDALVVATTCQATIGFLTSYLQSLQDNINKLQRITTGNPRLLLLDQLIPKQKQIISLETLLQNSEDSVTYSRSVLLSHRPPKADLEVPLLPLVSHRSLRQRKRKGRRIHIRTAQRARINIKVQTKTHCAKQSSIFPLTTPHRNTRDKRIHRIHRTQFGASQPAPPPRGAPGAASATNEECQPAPLKSRSLSGVRVQRRRLYRQLRGACREPTRPLRLGKVVANKGTPRRAASQPSGKQNAKLFRHLVLTQGLHQGPQRQKIRKPLATPQLEYGFSLKLGTQNAQGMAEILKHQLVLDIMIDKSIHIMMLTETRNQSYYTYNSQGCLWVLNGNKQDKYAGVIVVVPPHIRPFIQDVIQHTPRILQLTLSLQSGKIHIIGVYAPHDKLDYSSVKMPFWQQLQEIVSSIPLPESVYIVGDFNVRLQGRMRGEHSMIGPHVFGKGHLYAKTGPERNRTLFTDFLSSTECCDGITFKTPNPVRQITYREKFPPPKSWLQFSADPLPLLRFWDIVAALPTTLENSLEIGQTIRAFISDHSWIDSVPTTPCNDPTLFQSLDKIICRRPWLPTVKQAYANHTTGFPSDHYLLISHIQVKLGSKPPKPPVPIKYDYSSDPRKIASFNKPFRSQYAGQTQMMSQTTPQQHISFYADGSGSSGRATKSSSAGWGFVGYFRNSVIVEASGPANVDEQSPLFLEAGVASNNTGELSAIMEVLLYLAHPGSQYGTATIHYDSKWLLT